MWYIWDKNLAADIRAEEERLDYPGQRPGCSCQFSVPQKYTTIAFTRPVVENFHKSLTEEGFDVPVRSLYFFWVDRYIIEHKDLTRELMHSLVRGMVDKKFIHNCELYDFHDKNYLLVCRFTLSLYEIVFFLPNCEGYLSGNKYNMRIKGKIDLVSLRQLFKVFRINLWN